MKFGVAVFPGTWSDTDCFHVLKNVFHQDVEFVWHKETDFLKNCNHIHIFSCNNI